MKKIILLIALVISLCFVTPVFAVDPPKIINRTSLDNEVGGLTAISGAGLNTGDIAYVRIQDHQTYGS